MIQKFLIVMFKAIRRHNNFFNYKLNYIKKKNNYEGTSIFNYDNINSFMLFLGQRSGRTYRTDCQNEYLIFWN